MTSEYNSPALLIVDDEASVRDLLSDLLVLDYHVATAANGPDALRLLAGRLYDLLLTDLIMPEMDGMELIRRVRQDPATCCMPIIVVSSSPDAHKLTAQLAIQGLIVKPFQVTKLLQTVQSVIAAAQSPDVS